RAGGGVVAVRALPGNEEEQGARPDAAAVVCEPCDLGLGIPDPFRHRDAGKHLVKLHEPLVAASPPDMPVSGLRPLTHTPSNIGACPETARLLGVVGRNALVLEGDPRDLPR